MGGMGEGKEKQRHTGEAKTGNDVAMFKEDHDLREFAVKGFLRRAFTSRSRMDERTMNERAPRERGIIKSTSRQEAGTTQGVIYLNLTWDRGGSAFSFQVGGSLLSQAHLFLRKISYGS